MGSASSPRSRSSCCSTWARVTSAVRPALVESIAAGYPHQQALIEALSAKIEMELGELEPDEAAVFMEELGIAESGLDRVIALSYRLLGLVSFLTAGPDEVRAWPIPDGSSAVDAAGAIHSDLARGFIRAETVAYDDLLELGSMAEARKPAGSARRARPTRSRTATSSRSCSANRRRSSGRASSCASPGQSRGRRGSSRSRRRPCRSRPCRPRRHPRHRARCRSRPGSCRPPVSTR